MPLSDNEGSNTNVKLNINNEYAKNYNQWRQKEELNRLKQRYGEEACNLDNLSQASSESSEDEDEVEVSEKFEEDFYKVLALLKSKDPRIYDEKVSFFDEKNEDEENKKKKSKREKGVSLRDFERKIILERGGKYSDSEDESGPRIQNGNGLTYVQEQDEIRNSFKAALEDENEDEDLLVVKNKSEEQIEKEETRKKWLKGQEVEVDPKDKVLEPIRDFWANPNLDAGEKFLRDYILDRKYLDKNASDADLEYDHAVHDSDENLSEDEENIDRQEEFEYKYNFRFEEPDQEFIKRYPRTLENSMRKKDTRRAEKRVELKTRKEQEKIRKKEELKELKALKRKEVEEKLEKLKEITGNDDILLNMADLEGDFDPNEHDRKMQQMFNDEYYTVPEDDSKPQFPEIDEEINAELPFNNYEGNKMDEDDDYEEGPECEDPDFVMDADYDPTADPKSKDAMSTKKKKKGRNKKAELIHKDKPKFDPEIYSTYQEYIDRYYGLDYEDMIEDVPCRFKLRKSLPNDYGLTIEEIMMADDKELNKWCSLKKALEYKPEQVERNELRQFQQKAQNEALKRKILQSLYRTEEEPESQEGPSAETSKKRKRKKKKAGAVQNQQNDMEVNSDVSSTTKGNQSLSENVDDIQKHPGSELLTLKSEKQKYDVYSSENVKEDVLKKKKKQKLTKEDSTIEYENTLDIIEKVPIIKKEEHVNESLEGPRSKLQSSNSQKQKCQNVHTPDDEKKDQKNKKGKIEEHKHENLNENTSADALNGIGRQANPKEVKGEKKKQKKKKQQNILKSETKAEKLAENELNEGKSESDKTLSKKEKNRLLKLQRKQKYIKLKKEQAKKNAMKNKEAPTKAEESKETSTSDQSEKLKKKEEIKLKKLERKQMYLKIKKELAKKNEKNTEGNDTDLLKSLSADRLKAFGTNPKKFKNRLKYGNKG